MRNIFYTKALSKFVGKDLIH